MRPFLRCGAVRGPRRSIRRVLFMLVLLPFVVRGGEAPPRNDRFEDWMQLERERLKLDVQRERLEAERLSLIAERERMLREIEALRKEAEVLRRQLDDAHTVEGRAADDGPWLVLEPVVGRAEDGREVQLVDMAVLELLGRPAPDQLAVRFEGQRLIIPASSAAQAGQVRRNLAARRDALREAQETRSRRRAVLERELEGPGVPAAGGADADENSLRRRRAEWESLRDEEAAARLRIDRLDRLIERIDNLMKDARAPAPF